MTENDIRHHLHAIPFEPFELELTSGTRVEVRHPEALAMEDGFIFVLGPNRSRHEFYLERVLAIHKSALDASAS